MSRCPSPSASSAGRHHVGGAPPDNACRGKGHRVSPDHGDDRNVLPHASQGSAAKARPCRPTRTPNASNHVKSNLINARTLAASPKKLKRKSKPWANPDRQTPRWGDRRIAHAHGVAMRRGSPPLIRSSWASAEGFRRSLGWGGVPQMLATRRGDIRSPCP